MAKLARVKKKFMNIYLYRIVGTYLGYKKCQKWNETIGLSQKKWEIQIAA